MLTDQKDRRTTALILLGLSAIMLAPVAYWISQGADLAAYLGLTAATRAPWFAWLAALILAGAYILFSFRAIPLIRESQDEFSLFKLLAIPVALASGVMEEVVFRKWLMDWLSSQDIGTMSQIFLSAVVFGAAHLCWHLVSRTKSFSPWAAIATFAAGVGLATLYVAGGRNLGPCVLAHFLINLVIEPWLMLAAVSGKLSSH